MTDAEASNTVTFIGLVDRVNYGRRTNVPGVDYRQHPGQRLLIGITLWQRATSTDRHQSARQDRARWAVDVSAEQLC